MEKGRLSAVAPDEMIKLLSGPFQGHSGVDKTIIKMTQGWFEFQCRGDREIGNRRAD